MYTVSTPYGPCTAATLALAIALRAILGGYVVKGR